MNTEKRTTMVVISGFSGAGKGTVINRFLAENEDYFFSVSATTRDPRPGETHGVEYIFITKDEFIAMIEADELLEHTFYADNYYGTPSVPIFECINSGGRAILDVEVEGALNIRKRYEEALLIYIVPPSAEELYRRLARRGTETKATILKRMRKAILETPIIPEYDCVLVNDDLEACVEDLRSVILEPRLAPVFKEKNLGPALSMRPDIERIVSELENGLR